MKNISLPEGRFCFDWDFFKKTGFPAHYPAGKLPQIGTQKREGE